MNTKNSERRIPRGNYFRIRFERFIDSPVVNSPWSLYKQVTWAMQKREVVNEQYREIRYTTKVQDVCRLDICFYKQVALMLLERYFLTSYCNLRSV